jgi:hypothetical protein
MNTKFEREYYLIDNEDWKKYPDVHEIKMGNNISYQFLNKKIEDSNRLFLKFSDSFKGDAIIGDYYNVGHFPLFSEKIHYVLEKLNINGTQFIPATLIDKKGNEYNNFWYMHIFNYYDVLDMENSKFDRFGDVRLVMDWVRMMRFKNELLSEIKLENRLIFKILKYLRRETIFHKSIVDIILNTIPIGVKFNKISQYGKTFKEKSNIIICA